MTYFTITYLHDDWNLSYFEEKSVKGGFYTYSFDLARQQEVFVGAHTYPFRQIPKVKCTTSISMSVALTQNGKAIESGKFDRTKGYAWLR